MNDSTNVRIIADNIRKLEKMVKEAGSEVPTPGVGDTGKIIKVGSSGYELADEYSYTLPAISDTETDTGIVFGGETVYSKNFQVDALTSGDNMITIGAVTTIKNVVFAIARIVTFSDDVVANEFLVNPRFWHTTNSINGIVNVSAGQVGGSCILTVFYTKFPPTPEPANETKKKTTKKG